MKEKYAGVRFFKVDISENKEAGIKQGIEKLPTVKLFRKKKELGEVEGFETMDSVHDLISKHEGDADKDSDEDDDGLEYIDMDRAEKLGQFEKMARTRFKRVPDWQILNVGLFEAWKTKQLRPND